ncbi:MAG: aldehyde dehydrogenase family protein [Balneolaceae bacterium]
MPALPEELKIEQQNHGTWTGAAESGGTKGERLASHSPIDGSLLAEITETTPEAYEEVSLRAQKAFLEWRQTPAPIRGEVVRQIGDELRKRKEPLARLVTLEMGKIYQEALGEVQEMIDICDYATGLSRMLCGRTMHSERPEHRMYEQWHPLGPVGIISAFNFPVAVYSWNTMIAAVCGDTVIWKGSEKTPLCSLAVQKIIAEVATRNGVPEGVFNLVTGGRELGKSMAEDEHLPLLSATGSIPMGRDVGQRVAKRLGRSLLELGGNNAILISDQSNLSLAIRATLFGAVGTAGQRCTSTRRVIIHDSVYEEVKEQLLAAWKQLKIGDPLESETLVGPLIDHQAVEQMQSALKELEREGGRLLWGGEVLDDMKGHYVRPALAEAENHYEIVQRETFAPILYLIRAGSLEEMIALQNGVRQGLSSAIFTDRLQEAERFLGTEGSDCGIANVNIGTSGAEIGGAFGGEKETGGGREAGSDAWKIYMRRQTNTINFGESLPLAQGIEFDL